MKTRTQPRIRRGFSLIEILLALAILSIGVLSILPIFPLGIETYRKSRDMTILATLTRTKVAQLLYELSDPNMGTKADPRKIINERYLKHDRAFARYMSEKNSKDRWVGPVYESEVYPFEETDRYYWQYTVIDVGTAGPMKIGRMGVKGVLFQVEFKVYTKEQIAEKKTPLDLSLVKKEEMERPSLRQVFLVHNPYPALKYGKK